MKKIVIALIVALGLALAAQPGSAQSRPTEALAPNTAGSGPEPKIEVLAAVLDFGHALEGQIDIAGRRQSAARRR